jgi:hypothetical protein
MEQVPCQPNADIRFSGRSLVDLQSSVETIFSSPADFNGPIAAGGI